MNPNLWAILSSSQHNWHSVSSISNEMKACYQIAFPLIQFLNFQYDDHSSHYKIYHIAQSLLKTRPAKLVFIDHSPAPFLLLKILNQISPDYLPELTLHLYGNFFHHFEYYYREQQLLKNYPCRITAASLSHLKLLKSCCLSTQKIYKFPFPTQVNQWRYNPELGKDFRKKHQITDQEHVIIFHGRKSMQKNTLGLLHFFSRLVDRLENVKLLILGDFDESSPNYFSHYFCRKHGFFYQCFKHEIEKLPLNVQNKILDFYHLSQIETHHALCAADLFISPSLHHYEDFGLAPLEALSSGLPSILTQWGGHNDYLENFPLAHKIEVSLSHQGLQLNWDKALSSIHELIKSPVSVTERDESYQLAERLYSKESLSKNLQEIYQFPALAFQGFASQYLSLNRNTIDNTTHPIYNQHISHFLLKD